MKSAYKVRLHIKAQKLAKSLVLQAANNFPLKVFVSIKQKWTVATKLKEAFESSKIIGNKDTIIVNGLMNYDISVEEVKYGTALWTYIYYVGRDKKRHIYKKFVKGKLYCILFVLCRDSRILILDDVLKTTLLFCEKCQLSTRQHITGPLEFIKSKNINVDVRTNHSFIQIDLSEGIHVYQRVPEIVYIVGGGCNNIKGIILEHGLEKIKKIPMSNSTLFLFSRKGTYQSLDNNIDGVVLLDSLSGDEERVKAVVTLGFSPVD